MAFILFKFLAKFQKKKNKFLKTTLFSFSNFDFDFKNFDQIQITKIRKSKDERGAYIDLLFKKAKWCY